MSSYEHKEQEEAQFFQNFSSTNTCSGDGAQGGRGGDIGSYNNANSNNIVTHNTTIHIHSDEQLLSISRSASQVSPPLSSSPLLSSRGSGSHVDLSSPNPTPYTLSASRPHFICNEEGQALDLSSSDGKTVLSLPFHGEKNQQWFLSDDGHGRLAFMCMQNRKYLAFRRLEEDAALFLSITPFHWEVSSYGDKFRVGIPRLSQSLLQANLALSIGSSIASLRPSFETHNTLLYILPDTSERRAKIEAREIASRAGMFITTPSNIVHSEDDTLIDLYGRAQFVFNQQGKIMDLSGTDRQTVLAWDFHGDLNQQWAFERHSNGSGLVALKSRLYPLYIAPRNLIDGAGLYCTPHPMYWELSRDEDGFKIGIPGSHLGIGFVGETTKLRPLYANSITRLHLLENSEANVAEIRRGNFLQTVASNGGNRRPIIDAPRPSHFESFISTIDEPCFIVGFTGTVLDLAPPDRRVYTFGYHGDTNQQWIINTDGGGGATIQSCIVSSHYVKYRELQLDSQLVLDPSPFTWEMIKDGDGYRIAVPGTNFALSLGACARIRHLHEQPGTRVYLMDTSPQSRASIQSGVVSSSTIRPTSRKPSSSQEEPHVCNTLNHQGKAETFTTLTTSKNNSAPLPKYSTRPSSGKNNNTPGRGTSSSKECILQ